MPFEERRRHLMSNNTDWGAVFFPPSHGCIPKSGLTAPEEPTSAVNPPKPNLKPDATAAPTMEYEVTQQTRPKTLVSSKGWSVDSFLKQGFENVPRVSALASVSQLSAAIKRHDESGIPLIIEGWHKHTKWPGDIFTLDWFREHGEQDAKARNVHDWSDRDITLPDLIEKQRALPTWAEPDETERLYGKDAHCPEAWTKWLNEADVIPSTLLPEGPDNLLQCLPPSERVETLMCYLGIGDTFTPCHKDLCASSGQNIMCYTENSGSSFWFMTAGSDAPAAAAYFHKLGKELDLETHVITVEDLLKAPFTTYVAEQKLGDMVLVPPRSCHQVVNQGGITIKTSWSRMTLDGLATAFYHELPIYRRVCRNETYRVKYTIYHALLKCTRELEKYALHPSSPKPSNIHDSHLPASSHDDPLPPTGLGMSTKLRLENELRQHIVVFDDVLAEEYHKDHQQMLHLTVSSTSSGESSTGTVIPSTTQESCSRITCDFCGTDVFQSFFECRKCVSPSPSDAMDTGETSSDDSLVICSSCYVEGRSCSCEIMDPIQCRPFSELLRDRNMAVKVLRQSQMGEEAADAHEILDESNVLSKVKLGIFDAAVIMYQLRQEQQKGRSDDTTRSCAVRQLRHVVYRSSQLYCKKCHSGLCFKHILDLGVHSAEAVVVYQSDSSHTGWHAHHRDKTIRDQILEAEKAEKDGTRCDVRHKLALTAGKFDTCMPSNPRFTKAGWYDKFIQISTIPTEDSEKQAIEDPIDDIIVPPTPLSPLSSLPPSPSTAYSDLPDSDDDSPLVSEGHTLLLGSREHLSKKRKRQVLDYILIPSLAEVLRSSSSPTTSQDTSATRVEGEGRGRQRSEGRETSATLPVDVETSSEVSESVPRTRKVTSSPVSKRSRIAARRRVITSSRETTPVDSTDSSSGEEEEPLMKRTRFEARLPGSDDTKSSASMTRKRIPDTITRTTASEPSCTATSPVEAVSRSYHPNGRDSYRKPPMVTRETTEEGQARNLNRSFGKGPLGSGTALPTSPPSMLSNRSITQADIPTRSKWRNGEKRSDKHVELLEKRLEAKDRDFQALQEQVKELKDLLQDHAKQDRIDGNFRLKIQQELSKLRKAAELQAAANQDLIMSLRTDIENLRTGVAGEAQSSMSPTNSTHIVLRDSTGRYLDFEHNNATPQFGYKSKGKPFPRYSQSNRQFITHSDNFQGQHPPQFPQQSGRDNERFIPPPSQPPRQKNGHVNGNRIETSGETEHHSTRPNPFPQGNFWREEGWTAQSNHPTPYQDYGPHNGNMFKTSTSASNRYYRDYSERNNEGWASRSISHRQGHGCDNGNKFNQPSQPPFHHNARGHWQRDPAAGPSKPYHQGPAALNKMPMKKWSRQKASQALVVSSPNNIHILPTLSSKIDQEQENCADSAGAPEHSMSPTLNGVEEPQREVTPSEHWEDEYDQDEEEPNHVQHTVHDRDLETIPTRPLALTEPPRATTPDANIAPDGSMESNPWA